jgi:hypothetical protein
MRGFIPDRLAPAQPVDETQAFAKVVTVDVGQRDRLNDADPPAAGHRGHQLGLLHGYMAPQIERHVDARLGGEASLDR